MLALFLERKAADSKSLLLEKLLLTNY